MEYLFSIFLFLSCFSFKNCVTIGNSQVNFKKMQLFIPLTDPRKIAKCLDRQRLGKQTVEAKQLLTILQGKNTGKGWIHHPIVAMYRGYESFVQFYLRCMIEEWIRRGYKNTMDIPQIEEEEIVYPAWWKNETIHTSHKANLVRKLPGHYEKLWPDIKPKDGYVWSNSSGTVFKTIVN